MLASACDSCRLNFIHSKGDPMPDSVQARILLVDDDRFSRTVLAAVFESIGITVEQAAHAEEAFGMLAQNPPHLILSDVVMPGMDGFALCQRVKGEAAYRHIPFLLLTSLSRDMPVRSLDAGADDLLSKGDDEVILRLRARLYLRVGMAPGGTSWLRATHEGASVMVISDSSTIQSLSAVHLAPLGVQVVAATSAPEAVDLLARSAPDVAVLDLGLGETAARDLIEPIHRLSARTQIQLLLGKGEEACLASLETDIQDAQYKPLVAKGNRQRVGLLLNLARLPQG
jgi:CheY-like chemotaxis protein